MLSTHVVVYLKGPTDEKKGYVGEIVYGPFHVFRLVML
jgi:hypothetical protein